MSILEKPGSPERKMSLKEERESGLIEKTAELERDAEYLDTLPKMSLKEEREELAFWKGKTKRRPRTEPEEGESDELKNHRREWEEKLDREEAAEQAFAYGIVSSHVKSLIAHGGDENLKLAEHLKKDVLPRLEKGYVEIKRLKDGTIEIKATYHTYHVGSPVIGSDGKEDYSYLDKFKGSL